MDEGSLLTDFSPITDYVFATHGFSYTVNAAVNSMTPGLNYRFRYRSYNGYGWSEYSNSLMVGLGPLPSKPVSPIKSLDEESSSATSIKLEWFTLISQTLTVQHYTLYMDDGYGVTFTKVFEGDQTYFYVESLTPAITYSFYVTATNFNGEGEASDTVRLISCVRPQNV